MGIGNLTELTDVDSAGRQRGAAGILPGIRYPQRLDHRSHQLVPKQRPRSRPGAPPGVSCREESGVAQEFGTGPGDVARSPSDREWATNVARVERSDHRQELSASSPNADSCTSSITTCICRARIPSHLFEEMPNAPPSTPAMRFTSATNWPKPERRSPREELYPGSSAALGFSHRVRGWAPTNK